MLHIIKNLFFTLIFLVCLFFSADGFSQKKIFFDEDKYKEHEQKIELDESDEENTEEEKAEVYSIFNDFRIPIRENINASDLRYYGWRTEANKYAFRCRDNKRIRLTYWHLIKGDNNVIDSEFINVTTAMDGCQKGDIEFSR